MSIKSRQAFYLYRKFQIQQYICWHPVEVRIYSTLANLLVFRFRTFNCYKYDIFAIVEKILCPGGYSQRNDFFNQISFWHSCYVCVKTFEIIEHINTNFLDFCEGGKYINVKKRLWPKWLAIGRKNGVFSQVSMSRIWLHFLLAY